MAPTRILHIVIHNMHRAGLETRIMDIFRAIDKEKFIFDFVVQSNEKHCVYDDEIMALGGHIYYLPPARVNLVSRFFRLRRLVKDKQYCIVHRHATKSVEGVDLVATMLGGVRVRVYHARTSSGASFKLLHRFCRPINNIFSTNKLAVSKLAGHWVFGSRRMNAGDVTVIPNAIDVDKFKFDSKVRERMRSILELSNKFAIINVARFAHVKNHKLLVEAFAYLHRKNPSTVLILAGAGALMEDIICLAEKMGLKDSVLFLGSRADVHILLQAADLFVMPSLYEGLPGAALEAQAAGLPCLLADTITKETKITKQVEFLPIDKGAEIWAEHMLSAMNAIRYDTANEIRNAGYDISDTVKWYEEFYLSATKKGSGGWRH